MESFIRLSYTPLVAKGLWNVVSVEARPPAAPETWSKTLGGQLHTDDPVDLIAYSVEHNVGDPEIVSFRLAMAGTSSGWKKSLNVPDGEGNNFLIEAEGLGNEVETGFWKSQALNQQVLTFAKAKAFGQMVDVMQIGDLHNLAGGDVIRFTWLKDR